MVLDEAKKKITLEIWKEYCQDDVTFINANQETTPDEFDQRTIEAIPKIKARIYDFLSGEIPLE